MSTAVVILFVEAKYTAWREGNQPPPPSHPTTNTVMIHDLPITRPIYTYHQRNHNLPPMLNSALEGMGERAGSKADD